MTIEEKKAKLVQLVKGSLLNDWKVWAKTVDHSSTIYRNKPAALELVVPPGDHSVRVDLGDSTFVLDALVSDEVLSLIAANESSAAAKGFERDLDKAIAKLEQ